MEYVMHVTVPDSLLNGDDSIEVAARIVNDALDPHIGNEGVAGLMVRPLSEVVAC